MTIIFMSLFRVLVTACMLCSTYSKSLISESLHRGNDPVRHYMSSKAHLQHGHASGVSVTNSSNALQPWKYHLDEKWTLLEQEPNMTLADVMAREPRDTYDIVYGVIQRVLGANAALSKHFILELIVAETRSERDMPSFLSRARHAHHPVWSRALDLDVMELDSDGASIILRGSSTIALCVAFNWYLEKYLNTTYDWRTYSIEIPADAETALPLPTYARRRRSVPFSYYENVCTVSYTQAFWTWSEWEPHLDWMALQGINMPLAFTGQEFIFAKTFSKFGFTQQDLQAFFSGPGFFAWQRMGNLRGWGGPITEACITDQYNLQLQILARMYSFDMIPALTAFAGHVPYALTRYFPDADVTASPNWWGSPDEWCCDLLLNFTDPLFTQIGAEFMAQQTKYFGSGHVYQCDTFNEMSPPTNDASYLQSASKYIYDSMTMVDTQAVWLMQGWLFQDHGFWTPDAVRAYLSGVARDAMIILDLYDEVAPQYNQFDSFYGTPFIWCTLHNFGGNQGLLGTLYNIAVGLPQALQYPNSTAIGVGITMEGIWQNYIVYDETLKMAFETQELPLTQFVNEYALRRYGLSSSAPMQDVWQLLASTVYNISHWGGVTKNLMCVVPHLNAIADGFMPTKLLYDAAVIEQAWQMFLRLASGELAHVVKYRYDVVDVTRQALSDRFNGVYQQLNASYFAGETTAVQQHGETLMALMTDMERLLNTNQFWMLGEWIAMARKHSDNVTEQDWWEFNARNQVTLWGPDGEISNYASKTWGGLIGDYHQPQWKLFIDELVSAMENNAAFNETAFLQKAMTTLAQPWQHQTNAYPTEPVGDTIAIACELFIKWNTLNDTQTCVH